MNDTKCAKDIKNQERCEGMSSEHGPVTQMSIREIAEFLNKLLPPRINKSHNIVPLFKAIASDDEIWKGVLAYRDFLHTFFVALAAHGHTYFKLKNKPKSETDYPFLYALADLLSDIGYFGELSDDHKTMKVTKLPSFTVFTDKNGRKKECKKLCAIAHRLYSIFGITGPCHRRPCH